MEACGATGTVFGHHGYGHQNYQQIPGGGILVPVLRAPPGLPSPALPLCQVHTFQCRSSARGALVLHGFGSFSCMHPPHAGQPGASRGVPKSRRRPHRLPPWPLPRPSRRCSLESQPSQMERLPRAVYPDMIRNSKKHETQELDSLQTVAFSVPRALDDDLERQFRPLSWSCHCRRMSKDGRNYTLQLVKCEV